MQTRALPLLASLTIAACAKPPNAPPARPGPSAAAATAPTPAPRTAEGTWRGALGEGDDALRIVVTLARKDDRYTGILDSVDQGASFPIDDVTLVGDTLRFSVKRVGGTYEGQFDPARANLTGTWTQKSIGRPLAFARSDTPAEHAPPPPRTRPLDAPIDVVVPSPPAAFRGADATHLAYELHLTNMSSRELTLRKVDVANADTHAPLVTLEKADLAEQMLLVGVSGADDEFASITIGPGLRAVVFVWIDLAAGAATPKSLEHRIAVTLKDDREEMSVVLPRLALRTEAIPVLGPPLRGGDWAAANGPSKSSGHRHAVIPVGGKASLSQRFAIDWIKIKDDATHAGDPARNASYHAYGADALAVADGVVAAVKDTIPENTPPGRAVPITLETIGGNHVVIDIGHGRFAFYGHLQPGSLKVKVGDPVKRGQVIGLVGNSGNSTEPHLHFHVSDGSSPLGAEGVPYLFEAFESRPAEASDASAFKRRARQLPTENEIVRFPGAPAKTP